MKFSRKQIYLAQLILGGLLVFISALIAADPARTSLGLWFGALWILLAWRYGFSPVLTALLVLLALRSPGSADIPASWFLSANLGITAFALAGFVRTKWSAPLAAVLWVSLLWISPPLLFLVLAGLPRFGKIHSEHPRWFYGPALLLFTGWVSVQVWQGVWYPLLQRPLHAETYQQLQTAFLGWCSTESLWRIVPVIGLFEVAQKQPDDHRFTWRNLVLFGALVSLLLVPVGTALQMIFLIALPLSAVMLTRWSLALPDLWSRGVYWLGLGLLALPFLEKGIH